MNEVYIDMRKENKWISKYFTKDLVSIDELLNCIEDLDSEIEGLKLTIKELSKSEEEKYEDHLCELADNYNDEVRMGLR